MWPGSVYSVSYVEVGATLNNIGEVYRTLNDMFKALDHYNKSLQLLRKIGNKFGEARTLDNIGKVYAVIGETRKALHYYCQSTPPAFLA